MPTPFKLPQGLETEAGLPLSYLFAAADRPFKMEPLDEMGFNPFEKTVAKPGSEDKVQVLAARYAACLLYTSPSPRDRTRSRMPSSA